MLIALFIVAVCTWVRLISRLAGQSLFARGLFSIAIDRAELLSYFNPIQ